MSETPVIVLNWNTWEHTLACLRFLRAANDATTVWLVDNGSALDRSGEALGLYPGLRVLRFDENYGFAGGMNRALRVAADEGYEFAYLLNNDCTVVPGFLRGALWAARSPAVAVVGSRIAYADESNSLFFDGEYYARSEKPIDHAPENRRVSVANGAGMLVRLAALERVGYFDERYFCYHEEVELCWRLASGGFSSVIAGNSVVHHIRGASDVDGNSAYYRTRNEFLLAHCFRGWQRWKRELSALYSAAIAGREAAWQNDVTRWDALAAAIDDGSRGRFGKRPPRASMRMPSLQFRMLVVLLPRLRWLLKPRDLRRRELNGSAAKPTITEGQDAGAPRARIGVRASDAR